MRPARTSQLLAVVGLALAVSLALLAAGCSVQLSCGGSTTTTLGPTSTMATLNPPTSGPVPTSVPSSVPSTLPSPPSSQAQGPTTTEALSNAETKLPDGTIKAMGFIDKVWEANGKRYLSIDYAVMLSGQAAIDAAVADGYIKPGETLDDDYYIQNNNPQKREFTVSPSVTIATSTRSGGMNQPATWADFLSFWSPSPPSDAVDLHTVPWWIIRNGDEVIHIEEQYLP